MEHHHPGQRSPALSDTPIGATIRSMIVKPIDPQAAARDLVSLWNGRLGDRFPLEERLYLQQLSMERGECALFGAFSDGARAVGYLLAKTGPKAPQPCGHISFVVADEAFSGRGIGNALFDAAESWLGLRGAGKIMLGGDTCHLFPGAPLDGASSSKALIALLESRGYAASGDEHDVAANLANLDFAALRARAPLAPGYSLRFYDPSMRPALEAFFLADFPDRWYSDTMQALDRGMPGRDLPVLVEDRSGDIVGFARIFDASSPIIGPGIYWMRLMGEFPGALGPIGVSASVRGQGLGLGFLRACLEALAERGAHFTAIDWTDLVDFYGKLGFRIWKSYRVFSRPMNTLNTWPADS
ncbi:MAG: GNAT family N-acetyltransferase [Rectinemataceae bacterium]